MATWQADFHVVPPPHGLPSGYREALDKLLPRMTSWDDQTEMWGADDGDRIDVSTYEDGLIEICARFDLRTPRPALYEQFVGLVSAIGGRLHAADTGAEVHVTLEAFYRALSESSAAAFVKDPRAYLDRLKEQPVRLPEEP